MTKSVLKVKSISKSYKLGSITSGTLSQDLSSFWYKLLKKENPNSKVIQSNNLNQTAENDQVWALRDINLDISKGEIIGVIGKNGAGKSTLLKIISRITSPTSGQVEIIGRVGSLLEVGTGFHPELTGVENIYLNGAILGMTKREIVQKLDEIVEFSGIKRYIDTPVKRYSSGMRVRLGFSVAAHLEPEILLIDEVLAVGDQEFQNKCLGKMDDISKSGRTILFVSHNLDSIRQLCTKAVYLKDGEIQSIGETTKIVSEYQNHELENTNEKFVRNVISGYELTGDLKITNIRFLNINHEEINYFISNEHCLIEISYSFDDKIDKVRKSELTLYIKDVSGKIICTFSTYFKDDDTLINGKNGKIVCTIPKLLLFPGNYIIDVSCYINNNRADWLTNSITMPVIADKSKDGSWKNINTDVFGKVIIEHSWK